MRYLIILRDAYPPFLTEFFDPENHFNANIYMVYDIFKQKFTFDGKTWQDIEMDHL